LLLLRLAHCRKRIATSTVLDTIKNVNTAAKLLDAMRANPRDWRIEQLQTVARQHSILWRQQGTSHCYFKRSDGATLAVPAQRPIKPIYIRQFVEFVKVEFVKGA
jgi:hypothetical protein